MAAPAPATRPTAAERAAAIFAHNSVVYLTRIWHGDAARPSPQFRQLLYLTLVTSPSCPRASPTDGAAQLAEPVVVLSLFYATKLFACFPASTLRVRTAILTRR